MCPQISQFCREENRDGTTYVSHALLLLRLSLSQLLCHVLILLWSPNLKSESHCRARVDEGDFMPEIGALNEAIKLPARKRDQQQVVFSRYWAEVA